MAADNAPPALASIVFTAMIPEEQIARWRKGHPLKVSLAARLRAETWADVA